MDNFLTGDEVSSLRESCLELVGEMDPKAHRGVFSTTEHNQVKIIYVSDDGFSSVHPCFIWENGKSGDINVCRNKTLNCYPNYTNGLYSENYLSNTKPNTLNILFVILVILV